MDRYCNQDEAAFQPGRIILDIEFVAGTAGAVPTTFGGYVRADGIESMSLAATGVYTVNLSDAYVGLAKATFTVEQDTYDASHGQTGYSTQDGDVTSASAPTVVFQCTQPGTGAAVAVTAGDTVRITLELLRLSVS